MLKVRCAGRCENKDRKMKIREKWSNPYVVFGLGCLLGSLVFGWIYGIDVIKVTNIAWLLDSSQTEGLWDLTQHYLGWEFYRQSAWHFPLGLMDGIYSEPVSIVYTDSIPLFAFVCKLLSPLLPAKFQYFGLFELMCYALMGGFGALLMRAFSKKSSFCLLGAFFFVISPVMQKRAFYHTALSAHFLIVAALCLWIFRDALRKKGKHYTLHWTILLCLSAMINAYFTPMILGIWLCSMLQEFLAESKDMRIALLRKILVQVPVALGFLLLVCYLMGYFYGDVSAATTGLENLSFNLLQFVNPGNDLCVIHHRNYLFSTQNYSALLPTLPTISGWQEEGFAYLGVGVIFLLVLCIVYGIMQMLRGGIEKIRASWGISIFLGMVIFTFLALSPTATCGIKTLYHIAYPDIIYQALSVFRSTGRLIWPVYYGLLALGLYGMVHLTKNWKKTYVYGLWIGLVFLQIYDLMPGMLYKQEAYAYTSAGIEKNTKKTKTELMTAGYQKYLTESVWDTLGEDKDEIVFYPPTQFGIECDPQTSCVFEEYALAHHMSLNVTYMSRDMSAQADRKTYQHFEERKKGNKFENIIYIFFDISELPSAKETELQYFEADGYVIGVEK